MPSTGDMRLSLPSVRAALHRPFHIPSTSPAGRSLTTTGCSKFFAGSLYPPRSERTGWFTARRAKFYAQATARSEADSSSPLCRVPSVVRWPIGLRYHCRCIDLEQQLRSRESDYLHHRAGGKVASESLSPGFVYITV